MEVDYSSNIDKIVRSAAPFIADTFIGKIRGSGMGTERPPRK